MLQLKSNVGLLNLISFRGNSEKYLACKIYDLLYKIVSHFV